MDDDITCEQAEQGGGSPLPFRRKVVEIQRRLRAPKSQYNKFSDFYYRNCEDILEGLKPLLSEYGVLVRITDSIEVIGGRFYIKATVCVLDVDSDERFECIAYAREPETKKGMDPSQITGATSSYARKYALNAAFLTDDNRDPDMGPSGDQRQPQGKQPSEGFDAYCVNCGMGYHFDSNDQYMQFIGQLPSNPCCDSPHWQVVQ